MVVMLIVLGLVVVAAVWAVGIYNGLVTARNAFKNAFAQIDVQLKRRYELIPNLVETVKGYMTKVSPLRVCCRYQPLSEERPKRIELPVVRNAKRRRILQDRLVSDEHLVEGSYRVHTGDEDS